MAAPVNRVYNYLCEGEQYSIDRNLLMGDRNLLMGDRNLLMGDRNLLMGDPKLLLSRIQARQT